MNMKRFIPFIVIVIGVCVLIGAVMTRIFRYRVVASSISIIGGADGPTSIFIAGKVGDSTMLIVGIVAIAIGTVLVLWKRREKK